MEDTRRRRSGGLRKLITAVFAVAFVVSIISTVTAFAAANLFKIQNAELSELSTTAEGSISSFDETNIVSNVTFHKLNDSAKYTITLKNTDTNDHVIESITDDNESPYISYEYDQHANEQINAGENLVFEVTAKYTTAITDINQRAQATNVKFFIHFTDLEEEIPIVPNTGTNPNTGDYIHFSVISLVISAAGLTIIGIIALKRHKKASKFIAAGIVTVAAIATTATVKAATVEINSFTINTSYALNDRLIVTYTDKNGDEQELIVNYGEPANIPDQNKDGHTITGWEDENGNPVDPTQPITEDIKIHPAYRAHTYTIKFNGNGATSGEMTDLAMTFGEAKTLPANAFTWAGHEYTGWDTEANGSGAHYGDVAEVTDLTTEDNVVVVLYAQWSVNPFHIDYNGNGATSGEMATTNCEYDQACELRDNAFEKYGYDFAGWKYNDTTYADKADVTNIIDHGTIIMQAQWTPHVYTITYTGLTNEEAATLRTAGNPDTYTIESPSFMLKNPEDRKDADGDTRERFVGWVEVIEPSTSVTLPMIGNLGNKTFNATWETVALSEYNITYNYDGGNVATANPTKLTKEQSATLNEPVKTGYTFTGWTGTTISGDTPVKPYTIPAPHQMGNLEYTAHYQAHTYIVAFDRNADDATGDTASMSMTYDEEKALTENGFARTGYTFAGWKLGDESYEDKATVKNLTAEDGATVTLAANWEANKFTVVYHANSDAVSNPTAMNSQIVTYDEAATLTPNAYEYEHYKFMGWATSENGAKVYDDGADIMNAVSEDNGILNLYAVWLERTAMFTIGATVNNALKELNSNASTFTHYTAGIPDFKIIDGEQDIATSTSNFPIWVWTDGETIYWWSEAEKPSLNPDSLQMFYASNYVTISLADINTSTATNLTNFMSSNRNLRNIDFGDGDFTNVTTMSSAFSAIGNNYTTEKLTFDLSSIKTSNKLTDTSRLFAESYYIGKIIFSDKFETSGVTNFAEMFRGCGSLSEIVGVEDFDTTSAIYLNGMFWNNKITSLDLTGWNTSNVTTIQQIFRGCSALATLNVSNWDVRKVTDMQDAFPLPQVTTLDLSQWQNSVVTNMDTMFAGASKLTEIDLSGIDTSHVASWGTSNSNIFNGTSKLETIYVSDKFIVNSDAYGWFFNDVKLEGGAGTKNNVSSEGWYGTFARIDEPCDGKPGYFTWKNHRYICFYANDGSEAPATTGQYVEVGTMDTLKANAFTRDGYVFTGWKDADNNEYTDEQVMADLTESKIPLELYAQWREENTSFIIGSTTGTSNNLNKTFKAYETDEKKVRSIKRAASAPNLDEIDETIISTDNSDYDIYAWFDGNTETAYWYTQSQKPKMNGPAGAFSGLGYVESIDISTVDTSAATSMTGMFSDDPMLASITFGDNFKTDNVENLNSMFANDASITSLDLNGWNTGKVISMKATFSKMSSLETLQISNWNTENVQDISNLFIKCTSLETLNIKDWNMKSLKGMDSAFDGVESLTVLDLSGWNTTSNLKSMNYAFRRNPLLRTIDISSFDTSSVTSISSLMMDLPELKTVYVKEAEPFKIAAAPTYPFNRSNLIVGGNGTTFSNELTWRQRFSVDDPAHDSPGFLTYKNPLVVTFDAQGGTASRTSYNYIPGTDYGTLPTITTSPEGKTFAGWYTAAEGGEKVENSAAFISNETHTLYAHWQ